MTIVPGGWPRTGIVAASSACDRPRLSPLTSAADHRVGIVRVGAAASFAGLPGTRVAMKIDENSSGSGVSADRAKAFEHLRHRVLFAAWFMLIAVAETVGRLHQSEAVDLTIFIFLLASAVATIASHRRRPYRILRAPFDLLARLFGRLRNQVPVMGLDLRGAAVGGAGISWPIAFAFGGGIALAAIFCATHESWPANWRMIGNYTSYSLFVMGEGLAWSLLAAGIFVSVYWPLAAIRDRARTWTRKESLRDLVLWSAAIAALIFVTAGVVILPARVAFSLYGVAAAVIATASLVPDAPPLAIVWRRRGGGALQKNEWRSIVALKTTASAIVAAVLAFAAGGRLMSREPLDLWPAAPISTTLAIFFLWTTAPSLAAYATLWAYAWWRGRALDPSRQEPPIVFLRGVREPYQKTLWVEALAREGMRGRFEPERPGRFDIHVEVDLCPEARPRIIDETARLPREFLRRVVRTDDVQCRRSLMRSIERLWKKIARRRFSEGSGYWFAPQHWFVSGLWRDQGKKRRRREAPWTTAAVGPRFERLFAIEARRHFYRVMRGVEIDMIFIEDGVGFAKFRRVLRVLFEVHDISGGTRRAEEKYFDLLPGTDVVIHEYDFGAGPRSPIPDFETKKDVLCARVLFVFNASGEGDDGVRDALPAASRPCGANGAN